jgi:phosphatidyl-myo-inositol dimannoside synthase
MSDVLLLTPTLHGADGLSCLSRQLRDALRSLNGGRVEVIHLEDGKIRYAAAVCRAAASRSTPPIAVVAHLHLMPTVWPLIWRGTRVVPVLVGIEAWEALQPARAHALRRASRAIAISHHTAREFKRANPEFANLTVDVCWPATPTLPTAPTDTASSSYALIVGRMAANERYKGHDELIDTWTRVRRAVPDARLIVAGSGDDVARLRERVAAAALDGAITFEEHVSAERLATLYRDCAFLVLPSRREGFGYVLLEAMFAGRACIGGKGAAEEIIVPGETGLIVDPASPDDLANAMIDLFRDPERSARMGAAGRERAVRVFSAERFAQDLERALAQC